MWHFIHYIVRPTEALLGVFCVGTAILLYPNQEGKIQSKCEDFWIRADDFQTIALSRHTAFMQQVAILESGWLDKCFGGKLLSLRSFVASGSFSLASAFFFDAVFSTVTKGTQITGMFLVATYVVIGVGCFNMPAILSHIGSRKFANVLLRLTLGALVIDLILGAIGIGINRGNDLTSQMVGRSAAIPLSFISDFFFVALTRRLLRLVQHLENHFISLVLIVANLAASACLVIFPF
jgi:hypothetical protein